MDIRSRLKPEGSITSGIAVAGSVFAIYSLGCGSMAEAHNSDANHPALASARKKAALSSFLFVSAMTLITKDANVGILGYSTMIAMDVSYQHAIMADPSSGIAQAPDETSGNYTPANVASIYGQADAQVS
jgi:hypothetical protein